MGLPREIAICTKGIIFIGTPHIVDDHSKGLLSNSITLCDSQVDSALTGSRISDILPSAQSITAKFEASALSNLKHVSIISFFEEPDRSGIGEGDGLCHVDQGLNHPHGSDFVSEKDTLLKGFNSIPIHGDHLVSCECPG